MMGMVSHMVVMVMMVVFCAMPHVVLMVAALCMMLFVHM